MKFSPAGKSAAEFNELMKSWLGEKGLEFSASELSYWCGYITTIKGANHSQTKRYWINRFKGWVNSHKAF